MRRWVTNHVRRWTTNHVRRWATNHVRLQDETRHLIEQIWHVAKTISEVIHPSPHHHGKQISPTILEVEGLGMSLAVSVLHEIVGELQDNTRTKEECVNRLVHVQCFSSTSNISIIGSE